MIIIIINVVLYAVIIIVVVIIIIVIAVTATLYINHILLAQRRRFATTPSRRSRRSRRRRQISRNAVTKTSHGVVYRRGWTTIARQDGTYIHIYCKLQHFRVEEEEEGRESTMTRAGIIQSLCAAAKNLPPTAARQACVSLRRGRELGVNDKNVYSLELSFGVSCDRGGGE